MMRHRLILFMVLLMPAGCATPPPTPTLIPTAAPAPATRVAAPTATPLPVATAPVDAQPSQVFVEQVDVRLLESYPPQMRVLITGHTPDACTQVTGAETRRAGMRLLVTLTTARTGEICAQVLTPFEQSVSLDVTDLPGGLYTVDVHGITTGVTLPDPGVAAPQIETPVTQVVALVNVPIYTTQDASSPVIGWVTAGTVARVTGRDPLGLWWRVVCPDATVGDCWVSADPKVTRPVAP